MSDVTIDLTKLNECLPELEKLWQEKDDATFAYGAGIDAVSDRCGIDKKALRKLVTALKKDKTKEVGEEARELADIIEAIQG